ncbi:SDR family oxidoreductase [Bacillus gobiensis]|uniref:SDR family oxidoreductase n=1 Tax=Bacillus gobiensis TaxID=1441095 RepID=UPI003D24F580
MDLNLKDKVAIVAASSKGLGKAIAEELAKEQAHVILSGRNEQALKQVKEELSYLGSGLIDYQVCDLSNSEDIKQLIHAALERHERIDILVNNVGGPKGGSIADLTDDDWKDSFELHLLSYVRLIREALPHLKKNGGKIINIASSSVKEPIPGLLLSNTFRLGIVGLTKTLATELAEFNILINTLAPGKIATDRVAYLDQNKADTLGKSVEQIKKESELQIPLGSYGDPNDFAAYAAFLLSEKNTYMTGQTLLIDGGFVKSV